VAASLILLSVLSLPGQVPGKAAAPPNFIDVAEKSGLKMVNVFGGKYTKKYIIETTGTGVAIFDYDNDGWPDIFIVNGTTLEAPTKPAPTNHLYRNLHNGTFADVTAAAGLISTGWGQGACVGDFDNDGFADLFVTYYGRNRLYQNQRGKFIDISEKAGFAAAATNWSTGCAFVDYDRDGLLDIAVANYVDFDVSTAPQPGEMASCMWKGFPVMCGPKGLKGAKNLLYKNLGGGKFKDVSATSGIEKTSGHYCFSVSPLDFDNDGWPDIYVACDSTPSILYRNNRDGSFTDVAVVAGAAFNEDGREQAGMGSAVADYDGDGDLDIFRTNFSDDTSTLYRSNGNATFSDATFAAGLGLNTRYLGWGAAFLDFDNDSWPDLLLVNGHVYPEVDKYHLGSDYKEPRVLYRNLGNGKFADISKDSGPGITTPLSSRGLAVGDLWNDGRVSAVVSNMHALPSLLVNQTRYNNSWIAFHTIGTKSNRSGIGARLTVKLGERMLVDEVRSGSSYSSNNDMRVHFGLGPAKSVDYVEVRWPSGLVERFNNPKVNSIVVLKEGAGEAVKASASTGANNNAEPKQ
jgi:enediyne biosynthesis protein E4